MKGYKDEKNKFHPIKKYSQIRRKRSPSTLEGVKIIKKINPKSHQAKIMLEGIKESFAEQPKRIRDQVHSITLREREDGEDFIARIETMTGDIILISKPNLSKDDYKTLTDHELEHIDFKDILENSNGEAKEFIKQANQISPFTTELILTKQEQDDAFINTNFGIIPDKILEYPDEINSIVLEIESRQKLGLPTNILDENEFRKAKILVDHLHRKS